MSFLICSSCSEISVCSPFTTVWGKRLSCRFPKPEDHPLLAVRDPLSRESLLHRPSLEPTHDSTNARPSTATVSVLLPDRVTRVPEHCRLSEERNPFERARNKFLLFCTLQVSLMWRICREPYLRHCVAPIFRAFLASSLCFSAHWGNGRAR
jgi:hypothetical protein